MESGGFAASEKGSNFYLGFLFLPRSKREALTSVYAFCRHVDDIVDSGRNSREEAREQLAFWREEIGRLASGNPTHAVSKRLLPHVREYGLPEEAFREILRGMELDIDKTRYQTPSDLESYMLGAAGAVGLLAVKIFGYRHTAASDIREYALAMGNAFQLTNILRDVGADLERGRIYIPLDDILASGYSVEEFSRREHTPAFRALMQREYERAKGFYRKARGLLHPGDRAAMLPAEVMAHIYEDILEKIREAEYRVFFSRVGLSPWRKLWLAFKAWMGSW